MHKHTRDRARTIESMTRESDRHGAGGKRTREPRPAPRRQTTRTAAVRAAVREDVTR